MSREHLKAFIEFLIFCYSDGDKIFARISESDGENLTLVCNERESLYRVFEFLLFRQAHRISMHLEFHVRLDKT